MEIFPGALPREALVEEASQYTTPRSVSDKAF